jgi:hypothetical protein
MHIQKKDTLVPSNLDPLQFELKRGSRRAKQKLCKRRVNKSLKKTVMFASQGKTTARDRSNEARAAKRAEDQDEDSNLLNSKGTYARDKHRSNMNGNIPDKTINSVKFAIPQQSTDKESRKNPVILCSDNLNTNQEQYDISCSNGCSVIDDISTRRRKREEESNSNRTCDKPTSKRVARKTTKDRVANTVNLPVGCHGNKKGEERNKCNIKMRLFT